LHNININEKSYILYEKKQTWKLNYLKNTIFHNIKEFNSFRNKGIFNFKWKEKKKKKKIINIYLAKKKKKKK